MEQRPYERRSKIRIRNVISQFSVKQQPTIGNNMEIINKVAQSSLEVFDLEDYFPKQEIIGIDISQWLTEGIILKEKDFREALKNHNWQPYQNTLVHLFCSTDAILPAWATILVTTYLQEALLVTLGTKERLIEDYYHYILEKIDYRVYHDKSVILKGCSKKPVPNTAYITAIQKLQKEAKNIMFGEACSAVPLFKKAK